MTIATSMRSLTASVALGLRRWVAMVFEDGSLSDYYIRGARRLDDMVVNYAVIASLASRPTDGMMAIVLEDDRLVQKFEEVRSEMLTELEWLVGIGDKTWALFAGLIPNCSVSRLRTDILLAASTAAAYVAVGPFRALQKLPWSLAVGDVEENLKQLANEKDAPADRVGGKFYHPARLGTHRRDLIIAVSLSCRRPVGAPASSSRRTHQPAS